MGNSLLTLSLMMSCLISTARDKAPGSEGSFRLVLDSVYIYRYDQTGQEWNLSAVNYYFNGKEITDSIVFCDANRSPLSRVVYSGNPEGLISEAHSFLFTSGKWIDAEYQVFSYSESLLSLRTVMRWNGGQWINLNRFSYFYHDNNLLRSYHREIWKNDNWLPYSADTLIYDDKERLTERTATQALTGNFILRTLTEYDTLGRKASRLRQDYLGNNWVNVLLDKYFYDGCGIEIGSITQKWFNDGWINDSRSVPFFHAEITEPGGKEKIPVCHKGNTLYVPASAFKAHLRHGDCPGECTTEKNSGRVKHDCSQAKKDPPFILFPNPASDRITIRFSDNEEMDIRQIELTDFHGKLVKSYRLSGPGDKIIYREGLKSGRYYVRLIGREIFSTMVIFE